MNDRGQFGDPIPVSLIAVLIVVIFVGNEVKETVNAELATAQHNPAHLCNGMWGCGPAPAWWWALFAVAILAVLAVFLAITIVERRESDADS